MTQFRSGDEISEAFRWTGGLDLEDEPDWINEAIESGAVFFLCTGTVDVQMVIGTLRGYEMATIGDWICRDGSGRISAWKPSAFAATHSPLTSD